MPPNAAEDPRRHPARTSALTSIVSAAGALGRMFVDATGAVVPLPGSVRTVVATDEEVGAMLNGLGARVLGCAGTPPDGSDGGPEPVGASRAPDPAAVAALRPDVIVAGAVDRVHALADPRLVELLRRIAPLVAVDLGRPAAAAADLRALLGATGRVNHSGDAAGR